MAKELRKEQILKISGGSGESGTASEESDTVFGLSDAEVKTLEDEWGYILHKVGYKQETGKSYYIVMSGSKILTKNDLNLKGLLS